MENKRRNTGYLLWISGIFALALIVFEFVPPEYSSDEVKNRLIDMAVTRACGFAVFLPLVFHFGYRVLRPWYGSAAAIPVFLAALAVAVNNFPVIGLISGAAQVGAPAALIWLYALQAVMIGLFEEFAFRGVLYMSVLENRRTSVKQIFTVTLAASAAFGGIHLFNLLAGSSPGAVILQVGYSFLIGGMCSVVLLKTGSVWLCALIHAVYDFGGYLVPTLGSGHVWDAATVAVTALLGVAVLIYLVYVLLHIKPGELDRLFTPRSTGEGK